jgi:hypothetical protein
MLIAENLIGLADRFICKAFTSGANPISRTTRQFDDVRQRLVMAREAPPCAVNGSQGAHGLIAQ